MKNEKQCPNCGSKMQWRLHRHVEDVGGIKVSDGTSTAMVCNTCGEYELSMADLAGYERRAARTVLREVLHPTGAALKYARKALGLKQVDLAAVLGNSAESLSRYENNKEPIPADVRLAIAGLLEGVEQRTLDLSTLVEAARASHPPQPSELEVRPVLQPTG